MIPLRCAVLAALVCGCSGVPTAFEAHGFEPAEVAVLQGAADEWCRATQGDRCATFAGGDGYAALVPDGSLGEGVLGRAGTGAGDASIFIADRRDGDAWLQLLRRIALHELGHIWDCRDVDDPSRVMHYGIGSTDTRLQPADVDCATQ